VFVEMTGAAIDRHEAADLFRQALLAAKVDRAELHNAPSRMRRPVRLHDLRASMVTVALANGRTEEEVRRRTGHTSSALDKYRRVAGTLRELNLGDWTPLDLAIPELAAVAAAKVAANAAADCERPTRRTPKNRVIPRSRGERIRTSDPLTPSQVR